MAGKEKEQLGGWQREGAAGWLVKSIKSLVVGKEKEQLCGW